MAQVRDDQHFLFRLALEKRLNHFNLTIIEVSIDISGGLGVSIFRRVLGMGFCGFFAQLRQAIALARGQHKAKRMRLIRGMLPPERGVVQDVNQVVPLPGALDRADEIGHKTQCAPLTDGPIQEFLEMLAHKYQLAPQIQPLVSLGIAALIQ